MAKPIYRARLGYDDDPDWSWLEQWDTPEKYYGGVPKCSHGVVMTYDENHVWAGGHEVCPYKHEHDDACEFVTCPEIVTYDGHGNVKGAPVIDKPRSEGGRGKGRGLHNLVPFEDYMTYWGNPERHVFLDLVVEKQRACGSCGHGTWEVIDSLSGIAFMDDDNLPQAKYGHGAFYNLEEVKEWARGNNNEKYLASIVFDAIQADLERK